MIEQTDLAGRFTLAGTSMTMNRMGYGAMQLAGPHVFGPPRDTKEAVTVLRASGVNHIDTSDYYGPHVTNQIIKQALHPYQTGLVGSPWVALTWASIGKQEVIQKRSPRSRLRARALDVAQLPDCPSSGQNFGRRVAPLTQRVCLLRDTSDQLIQRG